MRGRGAAGGIGVSSLWVLAVAAVAQVAVYVALDALPASPWLEMDALVGFVVGLVPAAVLVWTMCSLRVDSLRLAVIAVCTIAVGLLASWQGWFAVAAPFKVMAGAALGTLLARQVNAAWWLALFAGVAVVADAWSVAAGPTREVIERVPQALGYLLVHFALLGGPGAGTGLGMSDVIFLALFTAGSVRFGLKVRLGYAAMLGSLVLTVVLAVLWRPALPALPLLSLAFLAVNAGEWVAAIRGRSGSRQEPPSGVDAG